MLRLVDGERFYSDHLSQLLESHLSNRNRRAIQSIKEDHLKAGGAYDDFLVIVGIVRIGGKYFESELYLDLYEPSVWVKLSHRNHLSPHKVIRRLINRIALQLLKKYKKPFSVRSGTFTLSLGSDPTKVETSPFRVEQIAC